MQKRAQAHLKNIINEMCLQIIFNIYMYKKDLALNNQQVLMYHKAQTTKPRGSLLGHATLTFCKIQQLRKN